LVKEGFEKPGILVIPKTREDIGQKTGFAKSSETYFITPI